MAVDAPVGDEPHQMQPSSRLANFLEEIQENFVTVQLVVGDGAIDAAQILINDPARPHADVSHLGVADDSGGKTHRLSRGLEQRAGIIGKEFLQVRCVGVGHRIVLLAFAVSPSVQDDEGQGKDAAIGDSGHGLVRFHSVLGAASFERPKGRPQRVRPWCALAGGALARQDRSSRIAPRA